MSNSGNKSITVVWEYFAKTTKINLQIVYTCSNWPSTMKIMHTEYLKHEVFPNYNKTCNYWYNICN